MSWSELSPQARAAVYTAGFLVLVLILWTWVVSPLRADAAATDRDLATAEQQLEQMEREIESVPPASDAERAAWEASGDEVLARLAPESELPLLFESLTRLAEGQNVDIFITSGAAGGVGGAGGGPTQFDRVLGAVPGAQYVPLECRLFGDYAAISRVVAQMGRLGWVTAVADVGMQRSFPEVVAIVRLIAFYRPDASDPASDPSGSGASAGRGGFGGGSHG